MLAKVNSSAIIGLNAVPVDKLTDQKFSSGPTSKEIRKRVQKARNLQTKRFKKDKIVSNAEMNNKLIKKYCALSPESLEILKMAVNKLNLSARSYNKILKVSRTIADLDNSKEIKSNHIAEALQYRPKQND